MTIEAPRRLSCVIFDMDGTITRTNELIFATFNHIALLHLGREYSSAEIIASFGPPERGALATLFGAANVDALEDELCRYYQENHARLASLHEGIDEILSFLKSKGVKLAVFTGKGRRTAEITLREFNLTHYFEMIVSGDDVVRHKPDPEGIRKVLEHFGVSPDETLMVGDALADITASRGAGVSAAAVVWDSYDHDRVVNAQSALVFHTPAELLGWLRDHLN